MAYTPTEVQCARLLHNEVQGTYLFELRRGYQLKSDQ